jgi:hypothetical protein
MNQESAAQEARDIDLVAELVNEVEVDDDEPMPYPVLGTPPRVEESEQDGKLSLSICFIYLILTLYTLRTIVGFGRQDITCGRQSFSTSKSSVGVEDVRPISPGERNGFGGR